MFPAIYLFLFDSLDETEAQNVDAHKSAGSENPVEHEIQIEMEIPARKGEEEKKIEPEHRTRRNDVPLPSKKSQTAHGNKKGGSSPVPNGKKSSISNQQQHSDMIEPAPSIILTRRMKEKEEASAKPSMKKGQSQSSVIGNSSAGSLHMEEENGKDEKSEEEAQVAVPATASSKLAEDLIVKLIGLYDDGLPDSDTGNSVFETVGQTLARIGGLLDKKREKIDLKLLPLLLSLKYLIEGIGNDVSKVFLFILPR